VALVSLCMIMKDEEEELPLVIASAAGLADEIVIYDTGSSDGSVALARELGATVVEGYWDDDFSRARNQALEYCTGEWILWLDADEAVHGDKAAFRTRLAHERAFDQYAVSIESLEGGGLGGRSTFRAARVFRREQCHWFGPLHEQIGLRDGDGRPATTICSELRILHRGYTSLKWKAKDLVERNLRIARSALEDPEVDHSTALFNYGRTLAMGGDPRSAIAPLREAADTTPWPMVRRTALRTIFDIHLSFDEFDEASEIVEQMRLTLTKTIAVDVMNVKLLLRRKDYEACLEAIDRLPFADTDEDGFEIGRASLSWAKAQALEGLGRIVEQVYHVSHQGRVELFLLEGETVRVCEDEVPDSFPARLCHHLSCEVDSDYLKSSLLERQGDPSCTYAGLQDALDAVPGQHRGHLVEGLRG